MSTTYRTLPGDTFELIARKLYGTEVEAGRIERANPEAVEPLKPGTRLLIPEAPAPGRTIEASRPDEVALFLRGERFRFWEAISITRQIDAPATISLSAPFESDRQAFRDTFRPCSYPEARVYVGGEALFTGTIVNIAPAVSVDRRAVAVDGYATPGVLNDCTPPASLFPLEFNRLRFNEIAARICEPFGIEFASDAPEGPTFERVACDPGKTAWSFLTELAKQRNRILADDTEGRLLARVSTTTGQPVARLKQGQPPLLEVVPQIQPQAYYSHITGLAPVEPGLNGARYTVQNPHLEVLRPHTYTARNAEDATLAEAVQAKAARMFGEMVSYSITVDTWRDSFGELWSPNTFLTLEAPGAMIYSEYTFLIRAATFDATRDQRTARLDLALPGAYSGQLPEGLPWDE